jgi:hypothetical protein
MRPNRCAFLVSVLMLSAAVSARAGDDASPRALIDKALKAHGGEDNLAKWPAVTAKIKGTFHGLGAAIPVTGEFASEGTNRSKFVIEGQVDGQKFLLIQILNGDKGWIKTDDDETEELDKDDLTEAKEEAYAEWLTTLVPLKDKQFRLALLGEINIDKRPALGIRVSSKGHRDVDLFFNKETGLLVKSEARIKDDDGQEVTEETILIDYKDVQGTKQAMRFTVRRDGKLYLECEVTEYRLAERLEDSVFAKP